MTLTQIIETYTPESIKTSSQNMKGIKRMVTALIKEVAAGITEFLQRESADIRDTFRETFTEG